MHASNRRVRARAAPSAISFSALCIGAEVCAATITPMTQQRSVHSMVMVPPCAPPGIISNSDAAIDFGPFKGNVQASRICEFAQGISTGAQVSRIDPAALIASGDTSCEVVSVNPTVIHAIPGSVFNVTFQTFHPVRYFIAGELTAAGANPVVVSYARLRITAPPNQRLLDHSVSPGAGGAPNTLLVHDTGALAAGQYTFLIETTAAVDAMVPPNGSGETAYDITARFQRPGDANIDGAVNVDDVLAVIGAWGACPGLSLPSFCTIDMDGDEAVEVDDLLLVIVNWD
jgi:hypothetical protein